MDFISRTYIGTPMVIPHDCLILLHNGMKIFSIFSTDRTGSQEPKLPEDMAEL